MGGPSTNTNSRQAHFSKIKPLPNVSNSQNNYQKENDAEAKNFQIRTKEGILLDVDLSLETEPFIKQIKKHFALTDFNYELLYNFKRMKELKLSQDQLFRNTKVIFEKLDKNNVTSENNNSLPANTIKCITEIKNNFNEYKIIHSKVELNYEIISRAYDQKIIYYFELANCYDALKQLFKEKLNEYKVKTTDYIDVIRKVKNEAKNSNDINMFRYILHVKSKLSKLYFTNKDIRKIKAAYEKIKDLLFQCINYYAEINEFLKDFR